MFGNKISCKTMTFFGCKTITFYARKQISVQNHDILCSETNCHAKQFFSCIHMVMFIQGPTQSGNDINLYLQLLKEEQGISWANAWVNT